MKIVSFGRNKLSEYDIEKVKIQSKNLRYDIKKFIYFYWCRGYDGEGVAVFLNKNDKWHIIDLGRCSCFGPTERLNSVLMGKEQVLELLKNEKYTYFDDDGNELAYVDLINYLEKNE